MFYVDTQRTTTRRDSSLITTRTDRTSPDRDSLVTLNTRGHSSILLGSDLGNVVPVRPKGSVQREIVTLLFESMLNHIVHSWEVIEPEKPILDAERHVSEVTVFTPKKKGKEPPAKSPKFKPSRMKSSLIKMETLSFVPWWSGSDERAIIHFSNGNHYEGNISMKCMHGEGRFQWADGTIYLGQFQYNQMVGMGRIQWKNDTWYEGEFSCNLRHGRGLYVESRTHGSYCGGWHLGTKHGVGTIYYPGHFPSSYNGNWQFNVRHGYGSRQYCHDSGYKGGWEAYTREGHGLMIWPNHDFYSGDWKNNVMNGTGMYIWNMYCNNSMSMPSINIYRGQWYKGKRNGFGFLNFGYGMGSHYEGEFRDNLKNGAGTFITDNGQIISHKALFVDDSLGPYESDNECKQPNKHVPHKSHNPRSNLTQVQKTLQFDVCDTLSLMYHIHQALNNIDREAEMRAAIIAKFIESNKYLELDGTAIIKRKEESHEAMINIGELITFEETLLRKALRCYESELRKIYFQYAKICNTNEINFTPNLIRLYLWQLYFDCNIHEKGLTLVQIDNMFCKNPEWTANTPHNPFEKVHFWQFQHSLITVATKLYAKKTFPGPKPDTILANAFRTFMDKDVLPGSIRHKGHLVNSCGTYVPLKALYSLYCSIGEPHTLRKYLCAALRPHHDVEHTQPPMVEAPDECLPIGRNEYVFEDDMIFTVENNIQKLHIEDTNEIKLFNFGNLSCKTIIKIFAKIFPHVVGNNKVLDLDIEITYYEFFEIFISCTEESIRQTAGLFREGVTQTTFMPVGK